MHINKHTNQRYQQMRPHLLITNRGNRILTHTTLFLFANAYDETFTVVRDGKSTHHNPLLPLPSTVTFFTYINVALSLSDPTPSIMDLSLGKSIHSNHTHFTTPHNQFSIAAGFKHESTVLGIDGLQFG